MQASINREASLNFARFFAISLLSLFLVSAFGQEVPKGAASPSQSPAESSLPAQPLNEDEIIIADAPEAQGPIDTGTSLWAIFRTLIALALVAAAVYGVVYFLRRAGRPRVESETRLKVLASTHLGSNRYVHVVNLGEKAWLVGASEGGVGLISEIEDKETLDAMLLDDSRTAVSREKGFRAMLNQLLGSKGTGDTTASSSVKAPSAKALRERRERLRGF